MRVKAVIKFVIPVLFALTTALNLHAQDNPDSAAGTESFLPVVPPIPGQIVRFDHLTVEDGLMSDETNNIYQTSDGFIWIGTYEGFQRYDGYQFKEFYHNPDDPTSISMNVYYLFYEDSSANFWIGTVDGLNLYDKETETFTRFYPDAENPDRENFNIFSISESSLGGLWIGTMTGLYHFHPQTGHFLAISHDPDDPNSLSENFVTGAIEDSRGELWVATFGGGLNRLATPLSTIQESIETGSDIAVQFDRISLGEEEGNNTLGHIIEDSIGNIWIATRNGLARLVPGDNLADVEFEFYRHAEDDPYSISGNIVGAISEDSQGYLWIGTQANGLNLFDRGSGKFRNFRNDGHQDGIRSDNIGGIVEDAQGLLWISTWSNGVTILDRRPLAFGYFREDAENLQSLSDSNVTAFWEGMDGELWIGTYDGLNQLASGETPHFTHYEYDEEDPASLSSNRISELLQDSRGTIWVGTYDAGLNRLKAGEAQFENYRHDENDPASLGSDRVNSLAEDSLGNIWVVTSSGLHKTVGGDDPEFEFVYNFESEQRSTALFEDSEGNLWIGNREGLKKLPKSDLAIADPQVVDFIFEEGSSEDAGINVRAIAEDNQGFLWIGSGEGIWKFDPQKGEFLVRYDVEEPVPKGVGTWGLVIDEDGNIWAGADTIYKFDPQSESFTQYTDADGVMSGLVNNAYRGPSGRIYFGGNDGMNAFFPKNITAHDFAAPTILTDFLLNNESIPVSEDGILQKQVNMAEKIVLGHQDDIFAFDFANLNYRHPEQNEYAYYLEGFDTDWIYTDANNRRATYTNISPGNYTFYVKGSNDAGVWNDTAATANIVITPPMWQTWWFRAAVLLLAVGLLYTGFRWRVSSVEKRSRVLEQEVADRTQQLTEINRQLLITKEEAEETAVLEERQRLARDLHDAITQSLYGVMLFARAGRDAQEAGDDLKLEENLFDIETNALQTLKEMRLLLYQLRPMSLEHGGFPGAINRRFDQVERRLGITATTDIEDNLNLSRKTEESLYFITTEALNNSLKHGKIKKVQVHLVQNNGNIQLTVEDNGRGFDHSYPKAGMGLKNMQERADLLGGEIEIKTEEGKGTRVLLIVPRSKNQK